MDFVTGLLLIAAAFNVVLGTIIFIHGPKNKADVTYAVLVATLVLWAATLIALRQTLSPGQAFFSLAASYSSGVAIAASFWYFVVFFSKRSIHVLQHVLILGGGVIVIFLAFSAKDFIKYVAAPGGDPDLAIGPLHLTFVAYFTFVMAAAFFRLYQRYQKTDKAERAQLTLMFLGTFATTAVGSAFNIFLVQAGAAGYVSWGPISTIIMVSLIAVAIMRHNLMSIRVIGAELFTLILIITLFIQFIFSETTSGRVLNGLTLLLSIIFGFYLIRSVIREVKQREEIETLATELGKANEELKRLDASKSEFISIASHQLRAPLTVIRGYVSLFLEGSLGAVTEQAREAMKKVAISAEQLVKLVADMLDLSRIESGRLKYAMKPVVLDDIVDEAVKEFEINAKAKSLSFIYQNRNTAKQSVMADPDKLREVVVNLIDNAIKYTAAGRVVIELYPEASNAKRWLTLKVQDSGMGIASADIGKMFTKFGRTEEARRVRPDGMGLGLYLVKKIIDDHGGRVKVESAGLGGGSTFLVSLPIAV